MKVAVIHDWLITYAGAERVLEQILRLYPQADVFTLIDFLPENQRGFLHEHRVFTSALQRWPLMRRKYRLFLPFMPMAVEQFDLSGYDLVISSSHAVAKGVLTGPDQYHVCICYTPLRYAWELQHQYLQETGLSRGIKGWLTRRMLHRLRLWDLRTANGVDDFIAISHFIARRIAKTYRRDATVIYPPVDTEAFTLDTDIEREDFYVTASRMVPYKKMEMIVAAFSRMPDRKLVVAGEGPECGRIVSQAGKNVTMLGYQNPKQLRDLMCRTRAFVFAALEDFGIVPLEAQACGTPVIAYGKGGVRETIRGLDHPHPTGVFFPEQTVESLIEAVRIFEEGGGIITPSRCRDNALRFSTDRFRRELKEFIEKRWDRFSDTQNIQYIL